MKLRKLAAAALLSAAALPAAALAQAAPAITTGATVYGPQGGVVGTVEKVDGDLVIVNTGKHSATLQKSAFGSIEKGLAIGFTQAQLNDAIEAAANKAADKLAAALVEGAAVVTADGVPLGMIKSVGADDMVLIQRDAGPFSLPKAAFALDATTLKVSMTQAQIDEALAAAAPVAPAAAAE